jgi:lipid A ethanolaminephosphotransferase
MKSSFVKLFVIASMTLLGYSYFLDEYFLFVKGAGNLYERGKWGAIGIYCIVSLAIFLSVFICAFLANDLVRILFGLTFVVNVAILILYREITGASHEWLSREYIGILDLLWTEYPLALDFVRGHKPEFLCATLIALLVGAAICAPPSRKFRLQGWWTYVPIVSLTAACVTMVYTNGGLSHNFPLTATLTAKIAFGALSRETKDPFEGHRAGPPLKPAVVELKRGRPGGPAFRKIVFIMDESIRGDFTSLGNPAIDTTPSLSSYAHIANFGIATSAHNCSTISRYILRYGIRPEQLPQAIQGGLNVGGPTIWQYAKRVGLKTIHIDAWGGIYGGLHSGMTIPEYRMVDQAIPVKVKPRYLSDLQVAKELIEALADPTPSFIYVDKYGAHPPYDEKFPSEEGRFSFEGEEDSVGRTFRLYKNAVSWSVDGFFQKLLAKADLSDILVIYTADHGQNLLVDGDYRQTHCSSGRNISRWEAFVPLFSITSNSDWITRLKRTAEKKAHHASHFEIFPTLLLAFGYDEDAVRAKYGVSLLDDTRIGRRFLVGSPRASLRWIVTDDAPLLDAAR